MIKKLIVKDLCDDKELKTLMGEYLDDGWICEDIIDSDTDVYNENGDIVLKFRKDIIKNTDLGWNYSKMIASSRMRGASSGPIDANHPYFKNKNLVKSYNDYTTRYMNGSTVSKMTINQPVWSNTIGFFNARIGKGVNDPCRMTRFTSKFFDKYTDGLPYIQELSNQYKLLHPEAFKSQFDRIKLSPSYQIADTPFSTVTINRNFRTGLHKDKGDYGGVAVLSVLERGEYNGGVLMMPRYGIGIDIRQGDVLVSDVHQWHCNTELWTTEEQDKNNLLLEPYFTNDKNKMISGSEYNFDRISFVCYLREKMIDCPTENIKYVIPSYQRCNELKEQTLSYLTKNNIKNKDIYIFCRNDDKFINLYNDLSIEGYNVISTDVKGIGMTHNFITEYFDEGQYIVEIDDDLIDIIDENDKSIDVFEEEMNDMIYQMKEQNITYGGLYSVSNGYFMRKTKHYTTDLRYMLGLLRIRCICKDIVLETNYSEDFENCIQYYIKSGKILKNNWLCGITKNYAKGGCNGDGRNNETEKIDKEFLHNKYPQYTKLFQRKNGKWDLRLKHYKLK
jgi:hypothetical protein